ncbi:MAG: LysR substrate-binding domain-containing protein, partial [Pseudonocardiaceae bacterium]
VAESFDLAATPWLLREQGSATRTRVETYLKSQHATPPRLVLGSNGAVIAGAVAELGCALVSGDAIADLLADGRLVMVPAPGTPMRRPWHAVVGAFAGASTWLFVKHLHACGWRPRGPRHSPPPDPPTGGRPPRLPGPRLGGAGVDQPVAVEGEP